MGREEVRKEQGATHEPERRSPTRQLPLATMIEASQIGLRTARSVGQRPLPGRRPALLNRGSLLQPSSHQTIQRSALVLGSFGGLFNRQSAIPRGRAQLDSTTKVGRRCRAAPFSVGDDCHQRYPVILKQEAQPVRPALDARDGTMGMRGSASLPRMVVLSSCARWLGRTRPVPPIVVGMHCRGCLKTAATPILSPSLPRSGGEGRGEEALADWEIPPSSILSPLLRHGARKKKGQLCDRLGDTAVLWWYCQATPLADSTATRRLHSPGPGV